jgi:hypothetical protein
MGLKKLCANATDAALMLMAMQLLMVMSMGVAMRVLAVIVGVVYFAHR